jgi:hypothetical protein
MEPCLLCDPHSVARGNESVPICGPHHEQAQAVFESAESRLRAHLEQAYGGGVDEWVRQGVLPGLTWHLHEVPHRLRQPGHQRAPPEDG